MLTLMGSLFVWPVGQRPEVVSLGVQAFRDTFVTKPTSCSTTNFEKPDTKLTPVGFIGLGTLGPSRIQFDPSSI